MPPPGDLPRPKTSEGISALRIRKDDKLKLQQRSSKSSMKPPASS